MLQATEGAKPCVPFAVSEVPGYGASRDAAQAMQ